jgi:hypothetical protein
MSQCVVPELPDGRERVEGLQLEVKSESREMEILKNLPSFNSENFSRFGGNGASGKSSLVSVSHALEL